MVPSFVSSHRTELYDPRAFIAHAALLHQAFAHCARFPTAASRRSLDRVSVPMWPITLSGRLLIVALVSRYLPINLWRSYQAIGSHYQVLITVSSGYPCAKGRLPTRYSPVRRFPPAKSTEVSLASFSLDLHVLGTPPAFILSQDQTLK